MNDNDHLSFLREFIRELPDIACLSTLNEGRFIEVNDSLPGLLGYTREQMLGKNSTDLGIWTDPEDREKMKERLNAGNLNVRDLDIRFSKKDGSIIHCLLSAKGFNVYGNTYLLMVLKDVTSLRRTMEELEESRERFRALQEASFGNILIHDQGTILEINDGMTELTGFSRDEILAQSTPDFIAPECRKTVMQHIADKDEQSYEVTGLKKNGIRYPLSIRGKQMPYRGRTVRAIEFTDLTEQKNQETHKQKLEEQLLQIQKMDSIGTLVGGIAHDFNNILTVINGNAELAERKLLCGGSVSDSLGQIKKAVSYASDLTKNLMAFSRKQIYEPRALDINDSIMGMHKILSRVISEDISISLWLAENLRPVMADPHQIEQILMNLVINASDAILAAGRDGEKTITIETANAELDGRYAASHPHVSEGRYIFLAVSDNGTGMDEKTKTKACEPFFTTKEKGKGTGLGLSTVYGIVMQNGGHISIYSEPDVGTTFIIYWPVTEKQAVAAQEKAETATHPGSGKILVVEDNPSVRNFAQETLRASGYSVVCAENGESALHQIRSQGPFDLLLTDIVMPGMNGPELAQKAAASDPSIKVLFVSGYAENSISHNGLFDRDIHFLQKPYTTESLCEKIRSVIGGN